MTVLTKKRRKTVKSGAKRLDDKLKEGAPGYEEIYEKEKSIIEKYVGNKSVTYRELYDFDVVTKKLVVNILKKKHNGMIPKDPVYFGMGWGADATVRFSDSNKPVFLLYPRGNQKWTVRNENKVLTTGGTFSFIKLVDGPFVLHPTSHKSIIQGLQNYESMTTGAGTEYTLPLIDMLVCEYAGEVTVVPSQHGKFEVESWNCQSGNFKPDLDECATKREMPHYIDIRRPITPRAITPRAITPRATTPRAMTPRLSTPRARKG